MLNCHAHSKGCIMRFMLNDNVPEDSIDHHWTQTSYDGKPDSWVPVVGSHWHKHHNEYMGVLSGRIALTLDGETTILKAGDSPLFIPRLHVHSFKFFAGEPATFTEKTNPAGSFKEAFFEDIFEAGEPTLVTAMRAFYDGDTYVGGTWWVEGGG
jgi:mannose-6-phosphate isomerase-like protein (cupin superfamily)